MPVKGRDRAKKRPAELRAAVPLPGIPCDGAARPSPPPGDAARRMVSPSAWPGLRAHSRPAGDADLTRQHRGEPLGERIVIGGRELDSDGRPAPNPAGEVSAANAAGRYSRPA